MDLRSGDLVACSDPPGPGWLDLIGDAWAAGAAVLPLEPRLPAATRQALLDRCRPSVIDGARIHDDPVADVGLVIATSGTTGTPKAVRLSRTALEAAVTLSAARLGLAREAWACSIPVAHVGGMLVILRGLVLGVPVTFSLDDGVWASIVPTQLHRLVAAGARLDGRAFLIGGDRLDPGLRASAEALGARIVHTYGMTETCGGVVYDGLPLDEVRVGLEGERIVIDSPTLFTGYVGEPDRTGPFATNDRGRFVNDRVVVEGRIDDIVIVNGEKLDRAAIEATLRDIVPTGSISVEPDPEHGSRLVATVPADAPTDAGTVAAIRAAHGPLAVPRIERI